jgi:hypothetical protein
MPREGVLAVTIISKIKATRADNSHKTITTIIKVGTITLYITRVEVRQYPNRVTLPGLQVPSLLMNYTASINNRTSAGRLPIQVHQAKSMKITIILISISIIVHTKVITTTFRINLSH